MSTRTDFDLFRISEDHEVLREAVRAVSEDKIAPYAAAVDAEARAAAVPASVATAAVAPQPEPVATAGVTPTSTVLPAGPTAPAPVDRLPQ